MAVKTSKPRAALQQQEQSLCILDHDISATVLPTDDIFLTQILVFRQPNYEQGRNNSYLPAGEANFEFLWKGYGM